MNKRKIFKVLNILEPILIVLLLVAGVLTILFGFSNIDWISLGGQLRPWKWYENVTFFIFFSLMVLIPIIEIILFILLNSKTKRKIIVFTVIEIIISCFVFWISDNILLIILILMICNLSKVIIRNKNIDLYIKAQ